MPFKDPKSLAAIASRKKAFKKYYDKNREKLKAHKRAWYRNNAEMVSQYNMAYEEANKEWRKEYHKECRSVNKEQEREYRLQRYKFNKNYYYNLLGNKCVLCGSQEKMEFDHIDPKTKKFEISTIFNRKFVNILDELLKCQLLCKPCHIEKTSKERLTLC